MNVIFKSSLTACVLLALASIAYLTLLAGNLPSVAAQTSTSQVIAADQLAKTDNKSSLPASNTIPANDENSGLIESDNIILDEAELFLDEKIYFGDYVYEAQAGDNLTYLARKSVQIYLDGEPQIYFETSQVIAAETHIVQDLGAFELAIGQEVAIDVALVANHIDSANELDESAKACWARYEPIRETLDFIEPLALPQVITFNPEPAPVASDDNEIIITNSDENLGTTTLKSDFSLYLTIFAVVALIATAAWVLIIVGRQNKEKDKNPNWNSKKESSKKVRISESEMVRKAKALPKTLGTKTEDLKNRRRAATKKLKRRQGKKDQ